MSKAGTAPAVGTACDFDPKSLSVDEALRKIDAIVQPVAEVEQVALRDALGRILAADLISTLDVPAAPNSAMDGFAVAGADLPADGRRTLELIGTAWAGRPYPGPVAPGQAIRIMTGAPLPPGADTIVMQEDVTEAAGTISIGAGHRPGQHVRAAGEDLRRGEIALVAGRRVTPADIGLAASLGRSELRVYRRPRVAFLSTGDELRAIGETLRPGDVYDSNRYTLYGMLTGFGAEVVDLGVIRDDRDALRVALTGAARIADAVVSSAGASVGDADFVKQTLDDIGEVGFWKIAMKPGRPLAFGRIADALFFGLPGNPVSVMVTFHQFVRPALRKLMGENPAAPLRLQARAATALYKRPGRTEFQRGVLSRDADGQLRVTSTGGQGSGILSSMSQANCFIVLPAECGGVEAGAMVEVEPLTLSI